MPTSNPNTIPTVINLIRLLKPKTIIDIGCGFGKYGFLIREYLAENGAFNFGIKIDAVEGYKKNINPLHNILYNVIYNTSINSFIITNKTEYELAIMIDVFEHLAKNEAEDFISSMKAISLLITIPKFVSAQKGFTDDPNEYEKHRSMYSRKELIKNFDALVKDYYGKYYILISKDKNHKEIFNKYFKSIKIKLFFPPILKNFKDWINYQLHRELFLKQ